MASYWEVWSYDVWGGYDENCDHMDCMCGYSVNDRFKEHERFECKGDQPTDAEIKEALYLTDDAPFTGRIHVTTDSDDMVCYVELSDDYADYKAGYPLGEMIKVAEDSNQEG